MYSRPRYWPRPHNRFIIGGKRHRKKMGLLIASETINSLECHKSPGGKTQSETMLSHATPLAGIVLESSNAPMLGVMESRGGAAVVTSRVALSFPLSLQSAEESMSKLLLSDTGSASSFLIERCLSTAHRWTCCVASLSRFVYLLLASSHLCHCDLFCTCSGRDKHGRCILWNSKWSRSSSRRVDASYWPRR
jgi:hypothetical protein